MAQLPINIEGNKFIDLLISSKIKEENIWKEKVELQII